MNGKQNQTPKGKKLTPQEAWNQTISIASERAPPSLQSFMNQLAMMENVPRKEKQFRNFTANSLRIKNGSEGEKIKDEIWKLLLKVREEEKKKQEEEDNKKKAQPKLETEKVELKSKAVSVSDEELAVSISNNGDGDMKLPSEKAVIKAMKNALKKAPNHKLKFKALRKQVQESLLFKTRKDGDTKKKWKQWLQQCLDSNPKKLVMDGKVVSLAK